MKVYLDYAASTPVDQQVLKAMLPFFTRKYGNASSIHSFGQEAKQVLEQSRKIIADKLNANPNEIYFTGSGTESNNLALKGVAFANKNKNHIIIAKIEHDCVLNSCKWLETQGFKATYLSVDKYGIVDLNELENSINKNTCLVSIMHANNEIGTIQPINEIAKICHDHNVYFHTDACQSFTKVPLDADSADLITINAHKIYGPKGVGALFVKHGVKIQPILHGGGHESGLRSSTENIPGIVGFAKAVELSSDKEVQHMTKLRDKLISSLSKIPDSHLNGHTVKRVCNNVNFTFKFIEGEALVLTLDSLGIMASTGSACSSKTLEPSHVLLAIGLKPEEAHGSLRLSLGKYNTEKEINYTIEKIPQAVEKMRKISPFKGGWK